MPKYKYVDGVKYRVVPQSVLGYALVREGSDNSLPAGGTDGQVLTKASNADYDVEWSTVEGGGGDDEFSFVAVNTDGTITSEVDVDELISACDNHKNVRAILVNSVEDAGYTVLPLTLYGHTDDIFESNFIHNEIGISGNNVVVGYSALYVSIENGVATFTYETNSAIINT